MIRMGESALGMQNGTSRKRFALYSKRILYWLLHHIVKVTDRIEEFNKK
jgi:hypothetical protein